MSIVISSDPKLLHILRGVVGYRAAEARLRASDIDCLALAVDEAVTNVMRHAYENRRNVKLGLEILTLPDCLEFVVEDTGPEVEPGALRPRDLDDVRPGGLRTHLVHRFVHWAFYGDNFPGGNRLRLVRHVSREVSPRDESAAQERR